MRRLLLVLLSICLLLCLAACSRGEEPPTWQTQYDLGMRYLSEGDYEEAVIAFRAAIEIDPRQPEAYISLAEAYIASEDYDKAAEAIAQGQQACGEHEGFERLLGQIAAARGGADGALGGEGGEIPLNAYGATQFEYRQNYYDFSEMTPEQQQVIEAAGNAAIAGDASVLHGILETYPEGVFEEEIILMIWNGYKMEFNLEPYHSIGEGYQSRWVWVIIRPENGMGYLCEAHQAFSHSEQIRSESRATCACAGWQWNGTEELFESSWNAVQDPDGYSYEGASESITTGSIANNLRQGIFTTTTHYMATRNIGEDEDEVFTDTAVYENGRMTEWNGTPEVGLYETTIGGIFVDREWGMEEYLNELYW